MSVLLAGNAPVGPILVTDAFVLHDSPEQIRSFRDTTLQFKITLLTKFSGCCSLVGDQIIEHAVLAIDNWATFKGVDIDLTKEKIIKEAVIPTAEELIQLFKSNGGSKQPDTDGAELYIISPNGAWEVQIVREKEKYYLKSFTELPKNKVLINYAGHKVNISLKGNEDNYFDEAVKLIEAHHASQNRINEHPLPYDLDSRFCGVFYPWGSIEDRKLIHPFRSYSEYLLFATGNQKPWEVYKDSKIPWEPPIDL